MKKFYILFFAMFIVSGLTAQIIQVPNDYSSIQSAIDASEDGDTILVDQGVYVENIDFSGKKILLTSKFIENGDTNYISNTIIDGSNPTDPDLGSVIYMISGEDTNSVVCGFTITGGTGTFEPDYNMTTGGAIYCLFSGGKFINNIIENNGIESPTIGHGGAIEQYGDNWFVLRDNIIRYNSNYGTTEALGGAAEISGSAIIERNRIYENTSTSGNGQSGGAGLFVSDWMTGWSSELKIKNNIIINNTVYSALDAVGGGLWIVDYHGVIFQNRIEYNQINASTVGFGSGICLAGTDTNLLLLNNQIKYNDRFFGSTTGGGVLIHQGKAKLINNIISENISDYGGGLSIIDTILSGESHYSLLINNTISNNTASIEGGGVYVENANLILFNSIVWGNISDQDNEITDHANELIVNYSDIGGYDVWPGTGNINDNPELCEYCYHLKEINPCKNKGSQQFSNSVISFDAPLIDIDNEIRPHDGGYDIGADEWYSNCSHIVNLWEVINNTMDIESLNVYPNPTCSIITIKLPPQPSRNTSLTLSNTNGQQVITQLITKPQTEIDISSLPNGIYIVKVWDDNEVMVQKVIKQ